MTRGRSLGTRLLVDDDGQDLVEYALLSAIISVAMILAIPSIRTKMGTLFTGWGQQVQSISIPNAPL
jgi:Flp pilus assembly pilin Flp